MNCQLKLIGLSIIAIFFASQASAMTLDEYLAEVQKKNKNFQSFQASQSAADDRYRRTDLELSPVLSLSGSYLDDKSLQEQGPGITLNHVQARQYTLGIGKKFSTGTQASIDTSVTGTQSELSLGAISQNRASLGVSFSQSLWKDFFGHGTRLRWERESALQAQEKASLNLQLKNALIQAEADLWDLLTLQQELKIREEGLERAKKIESWVRRRFSNGIGDRADVYNAEGLVAARQLQLLTSQDDLRAAQQKVANQLELKSVNDLPKFQADLSQTRRIEDFLYSQIGSNRSSGNVVRLDSYLAVLDAKAKAVMAQEANDTLRPDLVLKGNYRTNGYDSTMPTAFNHISDSDRPTSSIAIQFSWLLDWDTKGAVRNSAKMDALAASLKKERQLLEGQSSWAELLRRNDELRKKVQIAEEMARIQVARAAAERDRLSKGRTITSQVITAEQDADEAELTLRKLKAEQRKLEAQGKLFIRIQEGA